jgi:peptidylprolyl isomerase/peptidyl-prolyl cis-trans isomerase B (cyclophilin B)
MADGKGASSSADNKEGSTRAGCARNGLLGLGGLLIVVYLFLQAGKGNGDEQAHVTTTIEPRITTTVADVVDAVDPVCPKEDGSSPRQLKFTGPPPLTCLDADATYVATVETNRGDFEITLDQADAPQAVNSFVFLARYHYYDGVGFHRVIRDFLAQAGDPIDPGVANGDPGPGYLLPEEPPKEPPFYPEGSVAMANLYPKPNTTGGEFFVITGRGGDTLPPPGQPGSLSRIGHVTSGQEVIDAINATGSDDDVLPQDLTVIDTITITQR